MNSTIPQPPGGGEMAALRADVAAMREQLDELARVAAIFYDAGREDAMTGQPRPDGGLATVIPLRRKGGRS
jgi:hypothetical protein